MSFYVFTAADGMHFRLAKKPPSVTVWDDEMQPISATFATKSGESDCAASVKSNRFAMGSKDKGLSVFELESGELLTTIPLKKVRRIVTFDEAGSRLLIQADSGVVLLEFVSGESVAVQDVARFDGSPAVTVNNSVVVPSRKKDELLSVSLETGETTVISLPLGATLFDIQMNPCGPHMIAIDRKKTIHCIDVSAWAILWAASFKKMLGKDHMGAGYYSGAGTLFGAAVAARDHNYTNVIDAGTGELVRQIGSIGEGIPFRGTFIREETTNPGMYDVDTFDFADGSETTVTLAKG
jgi:hypothetical protein